MTAHLDWTGAEHWSYRRRPCIYCSLPTHLLDAGGRPSHKLCCQQAIDQLTEARTTP